MDDSDDGAMDKYRTKVVIKHNGMMKWLAPKIISSSCKFDVTYFPFDEQVSGHVMLIANLWFICLFACLLVCVCVLCLFVCLFMVFCHLKNIYIQADVQSNLKPNGGHKQGPKLV